MPRSVKRAARRSRAYDSVFKDRAEHALLTGQRLRYPSRLGTRTLVGRIATVNSKRGAHRKISPPCLRRGPWRRRFRECGGLAPRWGCERYLLATKRSRFTRGFSADDRASDALTGGGDRGLPTASAECGGRGISPRSEGTDRVSRPGAPVELSTGCPAFE